MWTFSQELQNPGSGMDTSHQRPRAQATGLAQLCKLPTLDSLPGPSPLSLGTACSSPSSRTGGLGLSVSHQPSQGSHPASQHYLALARGHQLEGYIEAVHWLPEWTQVSATSCSTPGACPEAVLGAGISLN